MSEFEYKIVRRPRKKTARLSVSPDDSITIVVPEHLSNEEVAGLVRKKHRWIRKKLAANADIRQYYRPKEFVSGEGFAYLGRNYRLKILAGKEAGVRLIAGRITLSLPRELHGNTASVRSMVIGWYIARGMEKLPERIALYARKLSVRPGRLAIKDMRTRWGSCNASGDLVFNWKILMTPMSILDYVVLHELCHIVHADHSKSFWELVRRIMPDFEERKEWLKVNGQGLDL